MLKINGVTCSIGDKKVLDNISLSVQRGELIILLGPSGVGKSTLLRILNNLQQFQAGAIELDGKQLDMQTLHAQHTVGMVFQNFNLFENLTVQENISLVLEQVLKQNKMAAVTNARTLLEQYGLMAYADRYPSQLSGGQKQRLAIARTLAVQPQIVCLDEPTSALDPRLTKMVADSIKELQKNRQLMVIVTTHDIGLVEQLSGTICLMRDGRIVEAVRSAEFYANKDRYPELKTFVIGS